MARHVNRHLLLSLSLPLALAAAACENNAVGRPCDVRSDGGSLQGSFNREALECPTRLCVKPALQFGGRNVTPETAPHCSAECSSDSDCDGEKRVDPPSKNPRDHRCVNGFVCGITFEVGPLACKKICLCKDFLPDPKTKPREYQSAIHPASCQ